MKPDNKNSKQSSKRQGKTDAKRLQKNPKGDGEEKQRVAAAGEVQYGQTIGRHGSEEETTLNPEE